MDPTNVKSFTVKFRPHPEYANNAFVVAEVEGPGAVAWARAQQSIAGENWDVVPDCRPEYAYACLFNHPNLIQTIEKEGYVVDISGYKKLEVDLSEKFMNIGCR